LDAEVALRGEIGVAAEVVPRAARLERVADRLAKVARKVARATRDVLKQPVLPLEALMEASVLAEVIRRRTDAAKDPLAQPLWKAPLDFPGLARDLEPGPAAGLHARQKGREQPIDDPLVKRMWM
jgi:hypothetical protein